ncbi:MAG: alanine racemase, partial [Alphaproteobacteria bacterium]|nr:alanine racemase [Alphaproteobacteria bacterium]
AAVLTIDLAAIVANYRRLQKELGAVPCAAVVKADAYGLGAARVAAALAAAGCTTFFVAHLDEGIALRPLLPSATIVVLIGPRADTMAEFAAHRLTPTLNAPDEISAWSTFSAGSDANHSAVLHIDTGMNRLGLSAQDLNWLTDHGEILDSIRLALVISHLVEAENPAHPLNTKQLQRFRAARQKLPQLAKARASLANSSGIFLGPNYHFDLGRPGAALYGLAPVEKQPNPMALTVRLQAPILQVRNVDAGESVGYGAAHLRLRPGRIATLPVGYADGYMRALSYSGRVMIANHAVPIVGRVSMDLITIDVTDVPPPLARVGQIATLIGPDLPPDRVGELAGTNGYEVLTQLGRRYRRRYLDANISMAGQ